MSLSRLQEYATRLETARKTHSPIVAFSGEHPQFTLEEGYAVQALLMENAGEKLAGYKMGLTSRAKQKDVNVHSPIRGFLLESMEVPKGGTVTMSNRIHPRTEPEIAVVLKNRLSGADVTLRHVRESLAGVFPALEILDSRYKDFSFKLPDVVADNTSASGFMVGSTNYVDRLDEVRLLGVTLKVNGEIRETGAPAAVLGDPLLSVVELVKGLAESNRAVEPGMVILTGGITTAVPFRSGDVVEVVWPGETLMFRAGGV